MAEAQGEPEPNDDPAAESPLTAAPITVSAIRFCRDCGSAWQPAWISCEVCSTRVVTSVDTRLSDGVGGDTRAILSSIFLYFALLAVSVVCLIVQTAREEPLSVPEEIAATVAMSLIVAVWSLFWIRTLMPLLVKLASPRWYAFAALTAMGTFFIAHFAVRGMHVLFNLEEVNYLDPYEAEGYGFPWAILLVCVQPAIFEELGFRGVILTSLQRVLGSNESLFVSAGLFAILHLSVPSIPHLFLMGLVLGWFRLRTGSMYPGMLLHFAHNLLVLLSERFGSSLPW